MRAQYPQEMRIVLQHQFWDLIVTEEALRGRPVLRRHPGAARSTVRGDQGIRRSVGRVRTAIPGARRTPAAAKRLMTGRARNRSQRRTGLPVRRRSTSMRAAHRPLTAGPAPANAPAPDDTRTSPPAAARSCGSIGSARSKDGKTRTVFVVRRPAQGRRMPKIRAKTRTETDTFGPIEVPADRYWGAQTERSRRNFRIGEERMPHAAHPRARHRQARRRRGEPHARLARCAPRAGDRARRAGSDRRQARRSFPAGGVADRLRHPDQHERQRGDRGARQHVARRQARRQSRRCIRTITST